MKEYELGIIFDFLSHEIFSVKIRLFNVIIIIIGNMRNFSNRTHLEILLGVLSFQLNVIYVRFIADN